MPLVFQPALRAAHVEDIRQLSYHGVLYGKAIGSIIDFTVVAAVVFLLCKFVLKQDAAPAGTK